jgi:hypothetical protein
MTTTKLVSSMEWQQFSWPLTPSLAPKRKPTPSVPAPTPASESAPELAPKRRTRTKLTSDDHLVLIVTALLTDGQLALTDGQLALAAAHVTG